MYILLDLPEVIQVAVLVDWLPLWSVASLDSALCNAELRDAFQNIAFDSSMRYTTNLAPLQVDYKEFISWLVRRNVYMDGMFFGDSLATNPALRHQLLLHQGHVWKWVVIGKGSGQEGSILSG